MDIRVLFIFLAIAASDSFAFEFNWKKFETASFQAGTWLENLGQVRANRSDDTNGFGITPFISASSAYNISSQHQIIPEVGYVIQQSSHKVTKNLFFFRADYAYSVYEWLKLRAGSSLMILRQSGSGGEDTLNNGNTTETYFIPEEGRNTYNQTLDLGVEFIQKEISTRMQVYTYAPFEEERRSFTFSLSLNYTVDLEELF